MHAKSKSMGEWDLEKRISFEDILSIRFRWPQHGDKPFVVAGNLLDNAVVANNTFARLVLMIDGYKKAGDIMVAASEEDWRERDILVFPIIFNYRQFLELSLKYQLAIYGPTVGISPNWKLHDLVALWNEFLQMLKSYDEGYPKAAERVVEKIVLEFAKADAGSFSFRYPVDPKGTKIEIAFSATDLSNLADVMNAIDSYFSGCDRFLSRLEGAC